MVTADRSTALPRPTCPGGAPPHPRWHGRLQPLPVAVFSVVMGMGGTAVALLGAGLAGPGTGYTWLGGTVLAVSSILVTGLAGRTLLALARGEICRPGQP